jgi:hypothetical protein
MFQMLILQKLPASCCGFERWSARMHALASRPGTCKRPDVRDAIIMRGAIDKEKTKLLVSLHGYTGMIQYSTV